MCTLELKICFLGKKLYYLYTFTMFFAVMITFVYCQGNAIALLIRVFTLYNLKPVSYTHLTLPTIYSV